MFKSVYYKLKKIIVKTKLILIFVQYVEKNVIVSRKKFIKLWKLYLGLTQNLIKLVMDIHTQSNFKICLIDVFFSDI